MPYTPPARSPASSVPSTPDVSRRPSLAPDSARPALPRSNSSTNTSRPSLPRSSSYAQRTRRSPSASAVSSPVVGESVRQSPPPVTDGQGMPSGAIISPPESSDDESGRLGVRARLPGDQVKELQQAISQIPQQRAGSPERSVRVQLPMSIKDDGGVKLAPAPPPRKSGGGHKRSVTEPDASSMMINESSVSTEEEDSEAELRIKPAMVRKKSGELVRPALRAPSHRRPASMPGTPIPFKAVHFDSHLEHVRHFLQVDRPTAVSAGSSPTDNYDSDTEYPFFAHSDDRQKPRQPPFEWELNARNFPLGESRVRWTQPVRLEKVWLSPSDQKSLIGSIVVANLAFHKAVMCRFTFDYWKTTSEMAAEYSSPVVPKMTPEGNDRFTFSIKLSDTANLESKTLYMCIRYTVNGTEYWDNNAGANFQIDFRKKHLPQNGKGNFQGASSRPANSPTSNALPRSNRRNAASSASASASPTTTTPPRSKASSSASPSVGFGVKEQPKPLHEVLGEPTGPALRFKTKSMVTLPSDNLSSGLSAPSGQAFAGRYDFGVSLRAAKDAERVDDGALYMKSGRSSPPKAATKPSTSPAPIPPMGTRAAVPGTSSPVATTGSDSPSMLLTNDSYDELVNKYCFFVSKQSGSPTAHNSFRGSFDAAPGVTPNVAAAPGVAASAGAGAYAPVGADAPPIADAVARDTVSYFSAYTLRTSPVSSPTPSGRPGPAAAAVARAPGGQSSSPRTPGQSSSSPRTSVAAMTPGGSTSPAAFQQFAGASPTDEYAFHLQDRFPFGGDAHAATAIRG